MISKSDENSRPGYTRIKANEYLDEDDVLKKKVELLADIIKNSKNCII